MEGDVCFVLTPGETGLPGSGAGASVDQYALRPPSGARGQLLLFFNGSGGQPRGAAGTAEGSWYGVARAAGLHVLGVSYASGTAVGQLCAGTDACFEPTRTAILTGIPQPGAASELSTLTLDEGAFSRIAAALVALALRDPDGGWEVFIERSLLPDAEKAIRWSQVLVSGHSQGGGHAALIGKRSPVERVLMLASPCDGVNGAAASWLGASTGFATDPATRFFGLGARGDTTCPLSGAGWDRLAMPPSARLAASTCSGVSAHGAPLGCSGNAGLWAQLLR